MPDQICFWLEDHRERHGSSGRRVSPGLEVVDGAVITAELPGGGWTDGARLSAVTVLMAMMRGEEEPYTYPVNVWVVLVQLFLASFVQVRLTTWLISPDQQVHREMKWVEVKVEQSQVCLICYCSQFMLLQKHQYNWPKSQKVPKETRSCWLDRPCEVCVPCGTYCCLVLFRLYVLQFPDAVWLHLGNKTARQVKERSQKTPFSNEIFGYRSLIM